MPDDKPELTINPDQAFFILMKAREIDAKVEQTDPDSGSNPSDDRQVDVLESAADDAAEPELLAAVRELNEDQQLDLIALIWIGRGDYTLDQWSEAREAARSIGRARVPRYVLGIPLVSDYLEDALAQLDLHLAAYVDAH
jgi:hypothetical protein